MRAAPSRVTTALVVATSLAWALAAYLGLDRWAAVGAGFIPARVGAGPIPGALPAWLTPLSATLVHGGAFHLAMNMLMLGFCGRLVETAIGAGGLVLLYVIGAYAAAAGQYLAGPHSEAPMIGASGAISAVIGAYALLYGERRIAPKGWSAGLLHVAWLAAAWIGLQLLVGLATQGSGVTVAVAAHVGGFLGGLALARPLLLLRYRNA